MVIGGQVEQSLYNKVVCGLLLLTLAALPWLDLTNLSTLLLLGLGAVCLLHFKGYKAAKGIWTNKLVLLSAGYYIFYIIAWIRFPADVHTKFALQQKAAFLVVPPLLYLLISNSKKIWPYAVWGMISGTVLALFYCLLNAFIRYQSLRSSAVFFYHDYVAPISANAIYISVYTLVAMAFVVRKLGEDSGRKMKIVLSAALLFLLGNLLLLSSKILIVAGILMIVFSGHRYLHSHKLKVIIYGTLLALLVILVTTRNQIKERYLTVKWEQSIANSKFEDYSNTQFDGLDLRLLLWRMGNELLAEHKAWITGMGGRRYQYALNEKMNAYKMYEGYQNIDLHNQYMESYVGFGVVGLVFFLTLLVSLFVFAFRQGEKDLVILGVIFCVSFLTESLLENQSGILLFTIIISGEWIQRQLY